MEETLTKPIRLSSFGSAVHNLKLENDTLSLDDVSIVLSEVTRVRIAVEPIRLDMFRIGVRYILLLENDTKSISIILRSYFSLHRKYFDDLYDQIIDMIWSNTIDRLMEESVVLLKEAKTVNVGKCVVSSKGVRLNDEFISWDDLSYQKNYNRLTLNSKSRSKLFTNLYYNENYNVQVLMVLLDWVFLKRGKEELAAA